MLWQVKSSLRNFKLVIILGDFGAHEMCFQHLNEPNSVPQWLGYSSSCKTTSFDEIIYLLLTYMEKPHVSWQKLEIYWKIIDTSKKVNFFFITMQKIMSKVQIYPQNVCLFIVASYILNNLVTSELRKSLYYEETFFNNNQYSDTFLGAKSIDCLQPASQNSMLWEFGKNMWL